MRVAGSTKRRVSHRSTMRKPRTKMFLLYPYVGRGLHRVPESCILPLVHATSLSRAGPSVMFAWLGTVDAKFAPAAAEVRLAGRRQSYRLSVQAHDSTKNTLPRLPTLPSKWKKRSTGERATATPTTASASAATISTVSISSGETFDQQDA